MLIALAALLAASQAQPADLEVVKERDPVVCTKSAEHRVGTRIKPKRTCMRQSERDAMERQTQRDLQTVNDRRLHPGPAAGRD